MSPYFTDLLEYFWNGFCCFAYAYLFMKHAEKKQNFPLRLFICIVVYVAIISLLSLLSLVGIDGTRKFYTHSVIMVCPYVIFGICYKSDWINVVFIGFLSVVLHHSSRLATNLLGLMLQYYGAVSSVTLGLKYLLRITVFIALYLILNNFVVKNVKIKIDKKSRLQTVLFFFIVGSVVMLLSVFDEIIRNSDMKIYFFFIICQIACCLLIVFMQVTFIKKTQAEIETAIVEQLVVRDHEQFSKYKENIEIINEKCHDIKHQMVKNDFARDEVSSAISEYDATVRTGNAALDIVLTEKSLRCGIKKILFTCVADGKVLSFMSAADICSLFGNALENAMESEEKYDEDKRFISVTVKTVDSFAVCHIENYFDGVIELRDGLPASVKGDDLYHGFGMKSMRRTVEKYDGSMSFSVKDDMFQLDFLFPL